jgi:hypothetical protein
MKLFNFGSPRATNPGIFSAAAFAVSNHEADHLLVAAINTEFDDIFALFEGVDDEDYEELLREGETVRQRATDLAMQRAIGAAPIPDFPSDHLQDPEIAAEYHCKLVAVRRRVERNRERVLFKHRMAHAH